MKISYKLLQTYFKNPLPPPEKIADLLNHHIFEVEEILHVASNTVNDVVLDVKVLPDRAPYCLSHQGVAMELSALIENIFIPRDVSLNVSPESLKEVNVQIKNADFCDRYIAVRIMNISGKASPEWLKLRLEALGQRSINLVVDLLNFVMLDIGEPMHAFDAEKIDGKIYVRPAKNGDLPALPTGQAGGRQERITTLDSKEITLTSEDFVVADDTGPLAIAGVKGGKRAEVTSQTSHIIVEAAHFNSLFVRKTSTRTGIKNESSKRFENNVSSSKAEEGMNYFLSLLSKEDSGISCGEIVDVNFTDAKEKMLTVPVSFIQEYLGEKFSSEEMIGCLNKAFIPTNREGENLLIRVPIYRKDLEIKEDVADEVGRLLGYDRLKATMPEGNFSRKINKEISWKNKIKNILVEKGYSEVYTYALLNKGYLEIENPLASDKAFMRVNLSDEIEKKLQMNLHNADLLGLSKIKIFEIGKVFPKEGERASLCIGIAHKKISKDFRPNDEIKIVRDELFKELGVDIQNLCTVDDTGGIISHEGKQIGLTNNKDGIMELDLDFLITLLPEVSEEISLEKKIENIKYKAVSIYPFATRDVAVFVPGEGKEGEVESVIEKHSNELLVRLDLFDVFTKADKETGEKKTSYAFRLVFQSYEKTLEEKEIDALMERITNALNDRKDWQVR